MLLSRASTSTNLLKMVLSDRLEANRTREGLQGLGRWAQEDPRFTSILAHTGSSTVATDVVAWAMRVAQVNSARLDVVHYAPDRGGAGRNTRTVRPGESPATDVLESTTRQLRNAVGMATQLAGVADESPIPPIGVHVQRSTMASSLIREIREGSVDLLVLEDTDLFAPHNRLAAFLRSDRRGAGLSVMLVRAAKTTELKRLTACVDFTQSARFAARQAISLACSCGATLRLVCPCHLNSTDIQWMAETQEQGNEFATGLEGRCIERLRQWLPPVRPDSLKIEVVCRQIPNWDYQDGLENVLVGEDADLLVLPLRRHSVFAAFQDALLIERIASAVRGSLLFVRR